MKIKLTIDSLLGGKEKVSLNELHWRQYLKMASKSLKQRCVAQRGCTDQMVNALVCSRCIRGVDHYTVLLLHGRESVVDSLCFLK